MMQIDKIIDKIVEEFKDEFKSLVKMKIIKSLSDVNVHSILQYILMNAGSKCGFIPIPEYKIKLSEPIDKSKVDERFKSRKIKNIWTLKLDVGFLKNGKPVGFGEIYTPDGIHGCERSKKLESPFVTPYHRLLHIAKITKNKKLHIVNEERFDFAVLVCGVWTLPSRKDAKRKDINGWIECWKNLIKKLNDNGLQTKCVFIKNINYLDKY